MEFDSTKAASNVKKQGVSFADAEALFIRLLFIEPIRTLRAKNASSESASAPLVKSWWWFMYCVEPRSD